MRTLVILAIGVILSACSGLMLGGGSTASTPVQKDRPAGSSQASDAAISSSIKSKYAADPALGQFVIDVRTSAGKVTLSGSVATYSAREAAEKLAIATDGAKAVDNQITVNYGK